MTTTNACTCPLCSYKDCRFYFEDKRRAYLQCQDCSLVFVPQSFHLSEQDERNEYEKHENDPNDEGYRKFLSRLSKPLQALIKPASKGLDFGCGPGPTLSLMMQEHGHNVHLYDKYFYPDTNVFGSCYDFITATEVVEHLNEPKKELDRLWRMLRPGGVLGIMTKLVIDQRSFQKWHYKNDQTHISFFSSATLLYLAEKWQATLIRHGDDAFSFIKQSL